MVKTMAKNKELQTRVRCDKNKEEFLSQQEGVEDKKEEKKETHSDMNKEEGNIVKFVSRIPKYPLGEIYSMIVDKSLNGLYHLKIQF